MAAPDPNASALLLTATIEATRDLSEKFLSVTATLSQISSSLHDGLREELKLCQKEFQDQAARILSGVKASKNISSQLEIFRASLGELDGYFSELQKLNIVSFHNKASLKKRAGALQQALRDQRTQLLSSVTLLLLSQPSPLASRTPSISVDKRGGSAAGGGGAVISAAGGAGGGGGVGNAASSSLIYSQGHCFYHGINRPKNYSLAFHDFQDAAQVGDLDAMYMLAKCFLLGHGVEQSEEQARVWFDKAAKGGSAAAKTELALMHLSIDGDATKLLDSMKDMLVHVLSSVSSAAAKASEEEKQSRSRKKKSMLSRLSIFSLSSKSKQPAAVTTTPRGGGGGEGGDEEGEEGGGGGEEDEEENEQALEKQQEIAYRVEEAIRLLLEAASDGYLEAQTLLGSLNETAGNIKDALSWYQLSASEGCPKAINFLGRLYLNAKGVKEDKARALELFISAVEGGDVEACYNAGLCFEQGIATNRGRDEKIARKLYQRGASLGHGLCMCTLGYLQLKDAIGMLQALNPSSGAAAYSSSDIFSKSRLSQADVVVFNELTKTGIKWLRMAAEQGECEASFQLGRVYEQGLGVPLDLIAACDQYKHAAALGHADAAYRAANILYSGRGLNVCSNSDMHSACSMYLQAAQGGVAAAMNAYALLLEDGRATYNQQPDLLEAAKWYHASVAAGDTNAPSNLALLLSTGAISSFITIDGEEMEAVACSEWMRQSVSLGGHAAKSFETYLSRVPDAKERRMREMEAKGKEQSSVVLRVGVSLPVTVPSKPNKPTSSLKADSSSNFSSSSATKAKEEEEVEEEDKAKLEQVDAIRPTTYVPRASSRTTQAPSGDKTPYKRERFDVLLSSKEVEVETSLPQLGR